MTKATTNPMEEEPKNTTVVTVVAPAKKGKKRKKKKKKISKHMADALLAAQDQDERNNDDENDDSKFPQKRRQQTIDAESAPPQKKLKKTTTTTQETNNQKKKNSSTSSRKTKDPSEAAKYLESWKHDVSHWKFHKNTQSWLIRHMYDFEKIPKHVFALLLEYLKAADAQTIARTRQDATRRALRYQKYTNQKQKKEEEQAIENDEKETSQHDKIGEKVPKSENPTNGDANIDDGAHWKSLSDHDKRKEYKRARKVLECLPENN